MTRLRAHHRRRSRGQSLVELALVLPLFLVFVAACLDLGRVFYANITLNNAAREGAFQAFQTPESFDQDQPCNPATNLVVCRVQLESKDSMVEVAPTDIEMTCSVSGCPDQAGSMVTVTVRGSLRLITPLLSFIFGGQDLDLASSATAQIEYLPDPNTATPPPAPVAAFTADDTDGLAPHTVNFDSTASTGDPIGWQWAFGDGGTSTEQNPTYTYGSVGTYPVTLTVINLSGVDTETKNNYITVTSSATPPPGPTPTPTTAPTPSCSYPPNVIGQAPGTASANLINAGFNVISYGDLTSGQKNKIQAQNPDHTQCLAPGTTITIHYRPPS